MPKNKTSKARQKNAEIAAETLNILDRGHYRTESGTVSIRDDLRRAILGTRLYSPDESVHMPASSHLTELEVVNETTLQSTERLTRAGHSVAALNFASARNPGGGCAKGSQAQEESIARASGLFVCIKDSEMYTFNRRTKLPMYSDHMIYSPGVPVFRGDDGALLSRHYCCAFLTAPAVNRKVAEQRGKRHAQIDTAMRRRTRRVLGAMAEHGHDTIVLGAWGCGVFRNEPRHVAGIFHDALTGEFQGAFARVVFAIPDKPGGRFILPFQRKFSR